MPKLTTGQQKFVGKQDPENARGRTFTVIQESKVLAKLEEVNVGYTDNDEEYWNCVFGSLVGAESGDEYPGKQFFRINLPKGKAPASYRPYKNGQKNEDATPEEIAEAWQKRIERSGAQLNALFTIAGFTLDSDTDELIGSQYGLDISVERARGGKHQGKDVNRVDGLFAPTGGEASGDDFDGDGGGSAAGADDEF